VGVASPRWARQPLVRAVLSLLLLCTLGLGRPSVGNAGGSRAEAWFVVKSEHFVVHGPQSEREMLAEVSALAEHAHTLLMSFFDTPPRHRTHIVLTDDGDGANGSAGVSPYNTIRLNAVPPRVDGSLGHYDHWMWNLIVHEYTHILHIGRVGGVPRAVNVFNNNALAPNQTVPRWFTEGLAVWAESRWSGTGRVESPWFQMQLRAAFLSQQVPELGTMGMVPLEWPQATSWYLFGGFMVSSLMESVTPAQWNEFHRRYSRQMVGYRFNAFAEAELGVRIDDAWHEWHALEEVRWTAWASHRTDLGLTEFVRESAGAFETRHVSSSFDRVGWIEDDGQVKRRFVVRGASNRTIPIRNAGPFDWLPDGRVVMSINGGVERERRFDDLWVFSPRDESWERITYAERAWMPTVSPSGQSVAYVHPDGGRTVLRVRSLESGVVESVFEPSAWAQIGRPAWIDEFTLVVPVLAPGSSWQLWEVPIDGEPRALTDASETAMDPHVVSSGLILFASDLDGAFELHALRRHDGRRRQLTRGLTGLFSPVTAELNGTSEVWASRYTPDGFTMVSLPELRGLDEEALWALGWTPITDAPRAAVVGGNEHLEGRTPENIGEPWRVAADADVRRRAPVRTLRWPVWSAQLLTTSEEQLAGVDLSGEDAMGANAWNLSVQWRFDQDTPTAAGSWVTYRLPVALGVSGSRTTFERGDRLFLDGNARSYREEQWRAGAFVSIPFPARESFYSLTLSYDLARVRAVDGFPDVELTPGAFEPIYPRFARPNTLALTWAWSDVEQFAQSFSPNSGSAVQATFRLRSAALGSDAESSDFVVTGRTYLRLGSRTAFAMRGAGGMAAARGVGRRLYAVGGLASQDAIVALARSRPVGTVHVRGYRVNAQLGARYVLATLEPRFLLANLFDGISVLPIGLRRLVLAGFVDVGQASLDRLRARDTLLGVGAELRLTASVGYYDSASLRLGIARGVLGPGIWDGYLVYGFAF
jgi:hypothetical protein